MNLVDDPWIPCIRRDGMVRPASLRDCFTCDDIVDLAVRPHERVALMRLLLCVSYAYRKITMAGKTCGKDCLWKSLSIWTSGGMPLSFSIRKSRFCRWPGCAALLPPGS
jgi:hypothetical protein